MKAWLRGLAWRMTRGARSERRLEAYRRRNARIVARHAKRWAGRA